MSEKSDKLILKLIVRTSDIPRYGSLGYEDAYQKMDEAKRELLGFIRNLESELAALKEKGNPIIEKCNECGAELIDEIPVTLCQNCWCDFHDLKSDTRWIPVGERLPDYDELVMCTNGKWVAEAKCIRAINGYSWAKIDGKIICPVNYWMPKPLPPEEGK